MKIRDMSRREMLLRAAITAASLNIATALTTVARNARADEDESDPADDNEHLNAALAAEYDAIATYGTAATIIAADASTPKATRDVVAGLGAHFRAQHVEHAAALDKFIKMNGGAPIADPATPCLPASFPATTAKTSDVIKLAADKEKHAAVAYASAIGKVGTATAAELLASIGAVETQHFVLLYALAEDLIAANDVTLKNVALLSPASFVLDVGAAGTISLETETALAPLLTLEPA